MVRPEARCRFRLGLAWLTAAVTLLWLGQSWQVGLPSSQALESSLQESSPSPAPDQWGPYAVGATIRCLSRPDNTPGQVRALTTAIWYPATPGPVEGAGSSVVLWDAAPERAGAPYPVLLWSHGFGHLPWASSFLATHLASHGLVVIAPSHAGLPLEGCSSDWYEPSVNPPAADQYLERPPDLLHVLSWALNQSQADDQTLSGLVDDARLGIAGHSRGANTALGLAYSDRRFAATLAMAPASTRLTRSSVANTTVPTMLMGGELDDLSPYREQQALFQLLQPGGPAHWFISFPRAGHAAFVDVCAPERAGCEPEALPQARVHQLIKRWTTAFLQQHLVGNASSATLLHQPADAPDPDVYVQMIR